MVVERGRCLCPTCMSLPKVLYPCSRGRLNGVVHLITPLVVVADLIIELLHGGVYPWPPPTEDAVVSHGILVFHAEDRCERLVVDVCGLDMGRVLFIARVVWSRGKLKVQIRESDSNMVMATGTGVPPTQTCTPAWASTDDRIHKGLCMPRSVPENTNTSHELTQTMDVFPATTRVEEFPNTTLEPGMEVPQEAVLRNKGTQTEVEVALISDEDLSRTHHGWKNVDLETRLTNIEQGVTLVDCHVSRNEAIALDVKYEVHGLRRELKKLRDYILPGVGKGSTPPLTQERSVEPTGSDKGKYPIGITNTIEGVLDMVAPNSPSDDDVVILEERNVHPFEVGAASMVFSTGHGNSSQWPFGMSGVDSSGIDALFMKQNVGGGDSSQSCGLYSSSDMYQRPNKNPRVENLEYSTIFSSPLQALGGVGMTPAPPTPVRNNQGNTPIRGAGRVSRKRAATAPPKPEPWIVIPEVINTAALISSLTAAVGRNNDATCWFFPSTVAHEILSGKGAPEIMHFYTSCWMPKTTELEHVFIHVHEDRVAWYMILLDVKNTRVYALDVNRSASTIFMREGALTVMGKVFQTERNIPNIKKGNPDPNTWGQIEYPLGLPAKLDPQDTAGVEIHVRMKAAIVIVSSEFNELKDLVEEKSTKVWTTFPLHHVLE
ncbi:hypothetical protein PIB30_026030 [Stylosanthes scabra]|uniref:Uncharacterized protein n=1 Tax=Stylosanthes scabra TaxID=79078 RepID=A0ABU6XBR2_9FABA|nr:hypothetical protein [Stylosanthes scabra]